MSPAHKTEIEAVEVALQQAMIASDVSTLDQLLADDLVFTNHLGQPMTKQDDLAAHRSGTMVINQLEPSDQQIKMLGDIAVVTVAARIVGTFADSPFEQTLRFTRVWWAVSPGIWQIIAAHASAVVDLPEQ